LQEVEKDGMFMTSNCLDHCLPHLIIESIASECSCCHVADGGVATPGHESDNIKWQQSGNITGVAG